MELRVHIFVVRTVPEVVVSQVLPASTVHRHTTVDDIAGKWLSCCVVDEREG